MKVTITFEIDETTLSKDAQDNNFEGFHCLVENLVRDGLETTEPESKPRDLSVLVKRDGKITKVVPIGSVHPATYYKDRNGIKRMEEVLLKQGQIEPLQINAISGKVHSDDPWGDEILYAARNLGWTNILIVYTNKYES